MAKSKLPLKSKKIIVSGLISAKVKNLESKFAEIETYIESQHGEVLQFFVQRRGASRSKKPGGSKLMDFPLSQDYYISKGKAEELKTLVEKEECDLVLFVSDLNARQIVNLQVLLQCSVITSMSLSRTFPAIQ